MTPCLLATYEKPSMFWLPFLPTERTFVAGALICPLDDAVKVEVMLALTLYRHTIVSWNLAARTRRFEGKLTDSALFLFGWDVPHPRRHRIPAEDFELHR